LFIDESHQVIQFNHTNSTQRFVHQLLAALEKQRIPSRRHATSRHPDNRKNPAMASIIFGCGGAKRQTGKQD
jgi:hypothetical protein